MINNNLQLKFVSEGLAREIENKIARLMGRNESCFIRNFFHKRLEKALEDEANLHSYQIEHPSGVYNGYNAHASKRNSRKGLKALERGFSWALNNFNPKKFDENFVRQVAAFLEEPGVVIEKGFANYRTSMVRAGSSQFTPPYPEKLDSEMKTYANDVIAILSEDGVHAALEGAAYAHLHLCRIHPFDDGNGRTSRTLQNTILLSNGLPPAIIYPGEKADYCSHLERAHLAWRERVGGASNAPENYGAEREFYNFIAGKVSASLDRLLAK